MSKEAVVLTHGDYVIRTGDMDILESNAWLNDTIIGFYFEYLSKTYPESRGYKFYGPEVTQCVKLSCKEEVPIFIGDPDSLNKFDLMFWPVNDSVDPGDFFGGSHWSLLVFSKRERMFGHFDSIMTIGSGNDMQARRLYEKLAPFILPDASYRSMECEPQRNGYDCGVHVLCNAGIIAKHGRISGVPTATADTVAGMRNHLVDLIRDLARKKSTSQQ